MDLATVLLILTTVIALSGVADMVAIAGYQQARGYPINWILLKVFIFRYISQYRAVTVKETVIPRRLFLGQMTSTSTYDC